MIRIIVNDRTGRKAQVKSLETDLVGELKQVLAVQLGIRAEKIILKKGYITLKDPISLEDYEIHDNTNLELYYE